MIAASIVVAALVLLALFESSSAVEFTDDVIRGGFHVKDKWPLCDSVFSRIRDQGECNSCWALAPADVLRDRLCIQQLYDHSSDDAKQKAQDEFKRNHESHRSAFPNISVTDILSCARFSLKRTACTIGGRPQMAWHHFETAGFLDEDPATSTSEFSYYFSRCDHTIPSTKVWQDARRQLSERETSAMRSVDSGLPYCHRRSLEPLECPPEIGNRRRQKVLASSASTTGVERIGGNTGIMGSNLDERIMRDILENGPVQASMGMLPALATIPFGPLTKPDEGPHSGGTDESWYPYVYRCVNSVWLRNLQSNPTAPENQRQNHAVRVVGWGSVPFHSDAYHKLFDVSNTSSSTIASAPTEGPRRNSSPINKLNRPRKAIASLRASSISAAQQARQFDDIGAPDSTSSQDEHATSTLLQLNRFRFKATDIAIPAASDNDRKRDDQHVDGAREAQWVDYWIVANSWGPYWGDKGFFYVQRGDNDCRLSHNAMSPNLASP